MSRAVVPGRAAWNGQRRIVVAFLISPGVVPLLLALIDAGIPRTTGLWMLGLAMLPTTYLVAFVFGIPALWLFRRKHWRRLWQFALAGAIFGWAPLVLFSPSLMRIGSLLAVYGGLGFTSAVIFWFVGVWGNPWFGAPPPRPFGRATEPPVTGEIRP